MKYIKSIVSNSIHFKELENSVLFILDDGFKFFHPLSMTNFIRNNIEITYTDEWKFTLRKSMKRHLLKQKMVDNNDTMKVLAQVLDIAPNTLYKKMQGTVQEFTQTEIRKIAERYDLTAEEIKDIFF